jgi:hypothetical protein
MWNICGGEEEEVEVEVSRTANVRSTKTSKT